MSLVLGIDTSSYTTSLALAGDDLRIVSSVRKLLTVPQGERGLRQGDAVFQHVRAFPALYEQLCGPSVTPDAVCVSSKPRDDEDSYMPVFGAGVSFARTIAQSLNIPLYTTTHQRGHFEAAMIGLEPIAAPWIGVHLSGGTTDLVVCDVWNRIGLKMTSFDLHAGQLIDRVGVKMGLSFPAGPELEKLAAQGISSHRYPVSLEAAGCHLSGAEAAAMRDIEASVLSSSDIAREVFDVLVRTLVRMLEKTADETGIETVLITGGVASSELLRSLLLERAEKRRLKARLLFGQKQYACDNAAGVARIGYKKWLQERKKSDGGNFKR